MNFFYFVVHFNNKLKGIFFIKTITIKIVYALLLEEKQISYLEALARLYVGRKEFHVCSLSPGGSGSGCCSTSAAANSSNSRSAPALTAGCLSVKFFRLRTI